MAQNSKFSSIDGSLKIYYKYRIYSRMFIIFLRYFGEVTEGEKNIKICNYYIDYLVIISTNEQIILLIVNIIT